METGKFPTLFDGGGGGGKVTVPSLFDGGDVGDGGVDTDKFPSLFDGGDVVFTLLSGKMFDEGFITGKPGGKNACAGEDTQTVSVVPSRMARTGEMRGPRQTVMFRLLSFHVQVAG
jgi:hypothetical protein